MESTIRLFKALPILHEGKIVDESLLQQTISRGFLFAPEVVANYPNSTQTLIELIDCVYGRSSEQLNQSFHKSWSKIQNASIVQLVIEQITHYITTYGFEALGIYDSDSVYIPREQLNAPELQEGLRLVIINGYTKDELKTKLLDLLGSGIALHEQTINNVLDVAGFVGFSEEDTAKVANKEVKIALYEKLGTIPSNPVEFLRYIVYKATNKTLIIKNKSSIDAIKARDNNDVIRCFDLYEEKYGLARLAEIFYRFKPLFLAFRTNAKLRSSINKIRRLAERNHKPMPEDVLNTVTVKLRNDQPVFTDEFRQALEDASILRKIRLAYALKFRTTDADSILYRIRNGKSYATSFSFTNIVDAQEAHDAVMASIVADVAKNVAGKKIYIPAEVKYGLPATEKQFTGNLPSGTYVELPENMVMGVHWMNVGGDRIDLDLSLISAENEKLGWNGRYRSHDLSILFSGDMTDAPAPYGASELFSIGKEARGTYIVFVNYYNFDESIEVPFKIVVAHEKPVNPETHYTVDPNAIVALSNTIMNVKQKNLGILVADENSCKFYFAESNLGNTRSSRNSDATEQACKFLLNFYTGSIVLNDVLVAAGAELVHVASEADIDLSPKNIDKTSILSLLRKI